MVIRKKKCRDCGNAITHNTVCCPYCGSVDPFGYYRNTDRIVTILLALIIVVLLTTVSVSGFAPIFPDICYHLTHYKPAAADIPV
ncbi:hypothetical protein, partial [Shigella flexneri]|uniref:hypothetical protein n=1 Tax=Shigella flexneri TaxID=623 RepID=UPI001A0FA721